MHKCIDRGGRCELGRVVLEEEREEEEEKEGCSAAVKRSERRLRSMLRGEIRLLPQL